MYANNTYDRATQTVDFLCLLMLLRNLRIFNLLTEFKDFNAIIKSFRNFASPMLHMLFTMYTVASIFCSIGMYFFNGGINFVNVDGDETYLDAPVFYALNNFNDFYSGLLTLFELLIENNWNNTTNMYADIWGNKARFYFCIYWVCMVLLMFNIVASAIMELYGTTSTNLEESYEKMKSA